jgi:hypothetical protein
MARLRSQTLLLDSSQGSNHGRDTPWRWTAQFEPGSIRCDPRHEYMTLTLEHFYTVASWDWIGPDATITVLAADESGGLALETHVTLPRGNPSLTVVADAINAAKAGVWCTYL